MIVAGDTANLSPIGAIVAEEWQRTPIVRPNVAIDAWVVMPDHFHGIIAMRPDDGVADDVETPRRGVSTLPAPGGLPPPGGMPPSGASGRRSVLRAGSLGAIVGQWKSVSTKRIRAAGYPDFAWQTRFYDVIIRDAAMLNKVRRYIDDNPRRYSADRAGPPGAWM